MTSTPDTEINQCDRLDSVAHQILSSVQPVTFRPAHALPERLAVFRLRAQAVIERGWMSATELPDGTEIDEFDAESTLICGWRSDQPIAAARLLWPDSMLGTPLESEYGIEFGPLESVVHLDRICVDRNKSDRSGAITLALIAACWLEIRSRGYHRFSGIDTAAVSRLYRRLGFQISVIGEPRRYWSEERFPILFDPLGTEPAVLNSLFARANVLSESPSDKGGDR